MCVCLGVGGAWQWKDPGCCMLAVKGSSTTLLSIQGLTVLSPGSWSCPPWSTLSQPQKVPDFLTLYGNSVCGYFSGTWVVRWGKLEWSDNHTVTGVKNQMQTVYSFFQVTCLTAPALPSGWEQKPHLSIQIWDCYSDPIACLCVWGRAGQGGSGRETVHSTHV